MIRRLRYNEIDFRKYTQCLESSEQIKYSASKIFLDVTSKKRWDLLVYNDYEAVMPIPYVRKYGIKVVLNPMLCQQLGVFSKKDDVLLNEAFLDFLKNNYLIRVYHFNDHNQFNSPIERKKNFIIYPDSYEKVFANYSPKRKRKLRLGEDILSDSEIRIISFNEAKLFIENNMTGLAKRNDVHGFTRIFKIFYDFKKLTFCAFYYQNQIINLISVYSDYKTLALLGTFNEKDFIKISGSSVLIDDMIKKNIETAAFDFEGSEVPSVEEFFRGFRPELKKYAYIRSSIKMLAKELITFIIKGKIRNIVR